MVKFHPWSSHLQIPTPQQHKSQLGNNFLNLFFGVLELVGAIGLGFITEGIGDAVLGAVFESEFVEGIKATSLVYRTINSVVQLGVYESYSSIIEKATTGRVSNPFSKNNIGTFALTATLFLLPVATGYGRLLMKTNSSFSSFIKLATNLIGVNIETKEKILNQAKKIEELLQKFNKEDSTPGNRNLRINKILQDKEFKDIKQFLDTFQEKIKSKGINNRFLDKAGFDGTRRTNGKLFYYIKGELHFPTTTWREYLRRIDSVLMVLSPTYGTKVAIRYILKQSKKIFKWKYGDMISSFGWVQKLNELKKISIKKIIFRKYINLKSIVSKDGDILIYNKELKKYRKATSTEKFFLRRIKSTQAYYQKRFGDFLNNPVPSTKRKRHGEWIYGVKINFNGNDFLGKINRLDELLKVIRVNKINIGTCDIMYIFDIDATKSRNNPGGKPPIFQRNVNFESYILPFLTSRKGWSWYYYHHIMWGREFTKIFKNEKFLKLLGRFQIGETIGEARWIIFDALSIKEVIDKINKGNLFSKINIGSFLINAGIWGILKNTSLKYFASPGASILTGRLSGSQNAFILANRRLRTKRKYKLIRRGKYTKYY